MDRVSAVRGEMVVGCDPSRCALRADGSAPRRCQPSWRSIFSSTQLADGMLITDGKAAQPACSRVWPAEESCDHDGPVAAVDAAPLGIGGVRGVAGHAPGGLAEVSVRLAHLAAAGAANEEGLPGGELCPVVVAPMTSARCSLPLIRPSTTGAERWLPWPLGTCSGRRACAGRRRSRSVSAGPVTCRRGRRVGRNGIATPLVGRRHRSARFFLAPGDGRLMAAGPEARSRLVFRGLAVDGQRRVS